MYEFYKNETNSNSLNPKNSKNTNNIRVNISVAKSNNVKLIRKLNNNKNNIINGDNSLSSIFQNNKETNKNKRALNLKENFINSFQQCDYNPIINNYEKFPYETDKYYDLQKELTDKNTKIILKKVRFHDFFKNKKTYDKRKIKNILQNYNSNKKKTKNDFQYYIPVHSIFFIKRKANNYEALYKKDKTHKIFTIDNPSFIKTKNKSPKSNDKLNINNKISKTRTSLPLINSKDPKNKTQNKFFSKNLSNNNRHLNIDFSNIKTREIKIKRLSKIHPIRKLTKFNMISQNGSNNGINKINQDKYFIIPENDKYQKIKIFGLFDGHGETGEKISEEVKEYFENYFFNLLTDNITKEGNYDNNTKNIVNMKEFFSTKIKNKKLNFNDSEDIKLQNFSTSNLKEKSDKLIQIYNKITSDNYSEIFSAFEKIDTKLHIKYSSSNFCHLSGSTALIIFLFNSKNCNQLISASLGDSKGILISKTNQIKELNIIHTLDNIEEKNRILSNGAEIKRLNVGPLRIWYKNKKYPGLSITRSLGDFESDSLGVLSTPDVKEYDLNEENVKILIFGTDGVWKFLTNEKIMDIILPYYEQNDVEGGTQKIKEIAYNLWSTKNPKGIADITVFVLFFK